MKTRLLFAPLVAAMLVGMVACSGCTTISNPFAAAEGLDEQAYAVMGTYNAFQKQIEKIALDETLPTNVRLAAADADKVATPVIASLSDSLQLYEEVTLALELGKTPSEDVAAVIANLKDWTEQGKAVVKRIKKAVSDAAKAKPVASTVAPSNLVYGSA